MSDGIAVEASGVVYVVDGSNHRIQKFTPDGTFLGKFGSPGSGPGQFNCPEDVIVAGGTVYVVDNGNARV